MLIQSVIVEASIANCKARELPCVPVNITAALNARFDKSEPEKFIIEKPSMSA